MTDQLVQVRRKDWDVQELIPTSPRGFVSKSSPYGTTEDPFIPAELAFGARATFFARSIDVELDTTRQCMVAAARHRGAAVTEVLQNCMIFNNGIHTDIADKEIRAERTITLRHGEKMLFGKNREFGLVLDGLEIKAVRLGQGYTLADVLVHDVYAPSDIIHRQLALMDGHSLPLALGVIRDVETPSYNDALDAQIKAVHKFDSLREMILAGETWEVK